MSLNTNIAESISEYKTFKRSWVIQMNKQLLKQITNFCNLYVVHQRKIIAAQFSGGNIHRCHRNISAEYIEKSVQLQDTVPAKEERFEFDFSARNDLIGRYKY